MKTVWILLGSIAVMEAATAPPVEPQSGYRVQLSATFPRVVYMAVSALADFVPKEEPVIVEAGLGNVRDQKLADAFHASWAARPAGTGNGKALAVRIRVDDDIRRAGTYNVVVNLQPLSQPQAGRWKLEIIQPAAQLEALPLSITRLRWTPSPFQEPLPKLMVREGSGDARLTLTSGQQWDTTPGKSRIQIIDSKLPEIPAGQGLEPAHAIAYELAEFPPGKVTHTLRFHAPQLTAPASVMVEVETRWPRLYLWFAIVVGLLAGYFAKVTLRNRIDLEQAKLQADELLSQAASDRARIHDEPFRQALDQPIAHLRAARDGTKRETIKTRHGELADALKNATAGHDLRMQNEQKARDQLRAVLGQDWNVPPGALAAIQAARQGLAEVEARFREFDADGAGTRTADIRHDLAGQMRRFMPAGARWRTRWTYWPARWPACRPAWWRRRRRRYGMRRRIGGTCSIWPTIRRWRLYQARFRTTRPSCGLWTTCWVRRCCAWNWSGRRSPICWRRWRALSGRGGDGDFAARLGRSAGKYAARRAAGCGGYRHYGRTIASIAAIVVSVLHAANARGGNGDARSRPRVCEGSGAAGGSPARARGRGESAHPGSEGRRGRHAAPDRLGRDRRLGPDAIRFRSGVWRGGVDGALRQAVRLAAGRGDPDGAIDSIRGRRLNPDLVACGGHHVKPGLADGPL